jgi:phosphohistidine phosphatase SixA
MAEDGRARRPTRIILVRHGESEGNVDSKKYCHIADPKIRLTEAGALQAQKCGQKIRSMIEKSHPKGDWLVHFYVSPYTRTLCTLKEIGRAFEKEHIVGVREEPRIREQDFGNFQNKMKMIEVKEIRQRFGRFFYRFPEGESAADVFDRVTSMPSPLSPFDYLLFTKSSQNGSCTSLNLQTVLYDISGLPLVYKFHCLGVALRVVMPGLQFSE